MRTTVVHVKQAHDIYIGRPIRAYPQPNQWYNQFKIGKDGTREDVMRWWISGKHESVDAELDLE